MKTLPQPTVKPTASSPKKQLPQIYSSGYHTIPCTPRGAPIQQGKYLYQRN